MPYNDHPMTIDEVLARRQPVPVMGTPVMGNPSQSGGLFTIATPKPRHVFTILCWNVQDFEEGKSEANPYVNKLINETLEALDVDLAILLETGENNAKNLTNIEFKVAHASDYKEDVKDEEDWDEKELASEAEARWVELQKSNPESSTYDPSLNVRPRYQSIGSAMTGKVYYPPTYIYPFHHPAALGKKSTYWPRVNKGLASGEWKAYYDYIKPYYQIFQTSTGNEITDVSSIPNTEMAEADLEFRLRVCGTCGQKYGRSTSCATCGDYGPYTTDIDNLAYWIQQIAFSFSYRVVLESYGVLVKPTSLGLDGPGGLIYADGLLAGVQRFKCDLMLQKPSTPRLPSDVITDVQKELNQWKANCCFVNGTLDAWTQAALTEYQNERGIFTRPSGNLDDRTLQALDVKRKEYQPTSVATGPADMSTDVLVDRPQDVVIREVQEALNTWRGGICPVNGVYDVPTKAAVTQYQQEHHITVASGQPDAPTLNSLWVGSHEPGDFLGYQAKDARYYGRCPFVIPLLLRLKGATDDSWVPLVTFHAPFGTKKKGEAGKKVFEARADALRETLNGDVGDTDDKPFGTVDAGILMGDLNLDINAPTSQQEGEVAAQAYGDLGSAGFINQIPKVPSSLIGLYNNLWKKQKLANAYVGANWHGTDGTIRNFTSSAYDNVLVKGTDLGHAVRTAGVIDVLAFIKANLSKLDLSHAASEYSGFSSLSDAHKAFFIYHRYVSDHLPILLDIEVEPMSSEVRENLKNQVLRAKHQMMQETERLWKLTYDSVSFLDVCPPTHWFVEDLSASTLIIGMVDELLPSQTARVATGTARHICDIRSLTTIPQKGDMLGVIVTKPSPANDMLALVNCVDFKNPKALFRPVDPHEMTAVMVGKVHRLSTDEERFMVLADRFYCVVEKRPEWPKAPDVGTWVVLVLKKPEAHPVQVQKKD